MKITISGPQSSGQIAKYLKLGSLFLSPEEYQRESAWNLEQKKLLIDTIFRGLDMPKFYLWKVDEKTLYNSYPDGDTRNIYKALLEKKRKENDDPEPYVFEVVDGQQRIRTMLEYMGYPPPSEDHYRGVWLSPFEALPETPLAKGRTYSKLNPEQQNRFEQTSLSVMILEDANIDGIRDMFLRLQNGTPLNAQQKRDAMGSHAGTQARILTELPFFTTSVAFGNEIGDHRRVASQMLYLESKDRIAPCTSQRLDKFYKGHLNNTIDGAITARAKRIVEILGKTFPAKCPHLNRSYALSLYWVMSRVLKMYSVPDVELPKMKDNFERLNVERLEAGKRDYSNPGDADLQELSVSMSHGTDGSEGIETRHDILMQFLFDKVGLQLLPKLDPQRDFTHEEKLILYHRAGGLCQLAFQGNDACERPIDFDNATVDHVLPHSKGGRTELTNGRYCARSCNISRGTRDDFDPAKDCCLLKDVVPAAVVTS